MGFDWSDHVLGPIYIIKCNRVAIHIDLLLIRMIITKINMIITKKNYYWKKLPELHLKIFASIVQ